jgi:TolB protein
LTVTCGCTDLAPSNNSGNAGGGIVMPRICIPIGDILFTTDREGDRDIYSMGTDGSHLQNVTRNGPLDDHTAAWAPDHTRFAYAAADPGEDHRIRIVTLGPDRCIDTDREIPNQPNGNNLAPRWSPDGQRLALHSNAGGTLDVWVMNASGGGLFRVAVSGYTDSTPTWSGDGRWIAFQSNRGTNGTADYEIWITRSDASGSTHRLTSDGFNDFGPMFAYAPSNRLIWHSKSSASELTFDLWVGDVNFTTGAISNVRRFVARPNDVDGNGWFSPGNDNAAVFDSRPGPGPTDVWIWDGSNATNLTNHPANDEAPSW